MGNSPWKIFLNFRFVIAAGFGTGAYALVFQTIWILADVVSWVRLLVLMLGSLTAMVLWLIVAHNLWKRPGPRGDRQATATMHNAATLLTLIAAVLISYVVLFALIFGAAVVFVPEGLLSSTLGHPIDLSDYARLAWAASSIATVTGALGSGLEDDDAVQQATSGSRDKPAPRESPQPDTAPPAGDGLLARKGLPEARREDPAVARRDDSTEHEEARPPAGSRRPRHHGQGGFKAGAAFFGWLVALALTGLLSAVIGAVAATAGVSLTLAGTEPQDTTLGVGIVSATLLLVVLVSAYVTGGYVAGRLARFDGARQGLGSWLLGLLVTGALAAIGVAFGSGYDLLATANLPAVVPPGGSLTLGMVVTLVVTIVGTGLAAAAGGRLGERYHHKIDRAAA